MLDQRRVPRRQVLQRGTIVLPGKNCTLGCTLLNLSGQGAMLKSDEWLFIPEQFEIALDENLCVEAHVRHRNMESVGVEFRPDDGPNR